MLRIRYHILSTAVGVGGAGSVTIKQSELAAWIAVNCSQAPLVILSTELLA